MLALALLLAGCASTGPTNHTRTATFAVDEARRAFTWTLDEPGQPRVSVTGDAAGTKLSVTIRGKPAAPDARERSARDLLAYFDAHIERLAAVPAAAGDVAWMKRFREIYACSSTSTTTPPPR
jgi:hypothetical protein